GPRKRLGQADARRVPSEISGEAPGEEPFGPFGLGEARGRQFTLEHVPWRAVGVAGDLFLADYLVAFGNPVEETERQASPSDSRISDRTAYLCRPTWRDSTSWSGRDAGGPPSRQVKTSRPPASSDAASTGQSRLR